MIFKQAQRISKWASIHFYPYIWILLWWLEYQLFMLQYCIFNRKNILFCIKKFVLLHFQQEKYSFLHQKICFNFIMFLIQFKNAKIHLKEVSPIDSNISEFFYESACSPLIDFQKSSCTSLFLPYQAHQWLTANW